MTLRLRSTDPLRQPCRTCLADANLLAIRRLLSRSLQVAHSTTTPGPPLPPSHPSPALLAKLHLQVYTLYDEARSAAKTASSSAVGAGDLSPALRRYLSDGRTLALALAYKWLGVDAGERGETGDALGLLGMARGELEALRDKDRGLRGLKGFGTARQGGKGRKGKVAEEVDSTDAFRSAYKKVNDTVRPPSTLGAQPAQLVHRFQHLTHASARPTGPLPARPLASDAPVPPPLRPRRPRPQALRHPLSRLSPSRDRRAPTFKGAAASAAGHGFRGAVARGWSGGGGQLGRGGRRRRGRVRGARELLWRRAVLLSRAAGRCCAVQRSSSRRPAGSVSARATKQLQLVRHLGRSRRRGVPWRTLLAWLRALSPAQRLQE